MENATHPTPRPLRFRWWMVPTGATLLLIIGCVVNWRQRYPHGYDHCCDKIIDIALWNYADAHGGQFPTGGETPEASLGLLYPKYADAESLRGKTYPLEPTAKLLAAGKPLTPETCGWHYVDGLSRSLPESCRGRIALFWDKFGSDHHAGILPNGGHTVAFLDGIRVVNQDAWPRFLAEQQKAVAAIRRGEEPEPPWIPEPEY